MRYVLAILLLGAGVMWGCSSETGGTLNTEWEDCQLTGATGCGATEGGGQPAVLICSETGVWMVLKLCPEGCDENRVGGGPQCLASTPDPDAKGEPDGQSPLPDVADDGRQKDTGNDGVAPEDKPVIPPVDVVLPELIPDYDPPWVESTSPADDEMGVPLPGDGEDFVITVVFTEAIHEPTIAENTVKVKDAVGNFLTLDYAFAEEGTTTLLITYKGAVFPSSPYTVILDSQIRDLAGNEMGNTYQFTFYTAATGTLTKYFELAAKFAPAIYQETNPDHPEYDYPTRYNLDGDWVATDNVDYIVIDAVKVEPHVYYSVTETKSHFFIQYLFYWPYRYAESESNRFGNDVGGAMVLVRKSDEAPIALETYFKKNLDERSLSFVTTDSGLITADGTFTSHKFDGSYDEADLFPNGHYVAYLSAREHESCLWLDENNNYMDGCVLNAGTKGTMKKIELKYKGASTPIDKSDGSFPQELTDVGYSISHMLESWWPRRNDVGDDKMWGSTYSYEPFISTIFLNRPGIKEPLPSVFVDPLGNDNGRPPWAWRYYPQNVTTFYEMPRGVWFLDSAVHFKQRHDQGNKWVEFDGQTGWSIEYCYNPYFNLDFRNVWPECTTK